MNGQTSDHVSRCLRHSATPPHTHTQPRHTHTHTHTPTTTDNKRQTTHKDADLKAEHDRVVFRCKHSVFYQHSPPLASCLMARPRFVSPSSLILVVVLLGVLIPERSCFWVAPMWGHKIKAGEVNAYTGEVVKGGADPGLYGSHIRARPKVKTTKYPGWLSGKQGKVSAVIAQLRLCVCACFCAHV